MSFPRAETLTATMPQAVEEVESDDEDDNAVAPDLFAPVPSDWYDESATGDDGSDSISDKEYNNKRHGTRHDAEAADDQFHSPELFMRPDKATLQRIPPPYAVAVPRPKISLQILPLAARELLASSMHHIYHTARMSYSISRRNRKYTELGNNATGFFVQDGNQQASQFKSQGQQDISPTIGDRLPELPCFSSLSWVERQLVEEWRTYRPHDTSSAITDSAAATTTDDDDKEFALARKLVPPSAPRPTWQRSDACYACRQLFGPARLRHHCRFCGRSYCQPHCSYTHALPQLGYDPNVPERVCDSCKSLLLEQNLAERVTWRLARCRDYHQASMEPYFETGQDSIEQILMRITEAALAVGRSIPLGAQAAIAVETVDVLRKYGLNGMYTIAMRQEFLAAADLLQKALGINQSAWPLSVHELSAAIFYALAQHRAMRGLHPEREHLIHAYSTRITGDTAAWIEHEPALETKQATEGKDLYHNDATISDLVSDGLKDSEHKSTSTAQEKVATSDSPPIRPVCEPVADETLSSLIFYAPMALNFIYAAKEVDMQLLAAQQGWRLVYAFMEQESRHKDVERPASALFVHEEQKIACVAVRGTATIHDVITDIRQTPVPFPDDEEEANKKMESDWTTIFRGHGLAVCGMAGAALSLYREHIDSILLFARQGYRIRLTGHSLGGGVSVLLGAMVYRDLEKVLGTAKVPLKVYAYGTPSCIDAKLAESVESFVITAVLHDDVIPRLTPTSCRNLLKHLLTIRETWVKEHFPEDFLALQERAKTVWAPTFRNSFTLKKSIKTYCRRKLQSGTKRLVSATEKLLNDNFCGSSVFEQANASDTFSGDFSLDASVHDVTEANGAVGLVNADEDGEDPPMLLLDYMGGIDDRSPGLVIDGDEYFDPGDDLIEESDDEFDVSDLAMQQMAELAKAEFQQRHSPEATTKHLDMPGSIINEEAVDENPEESTEAVLLEETPLPRMFVPGKIVHIYAHRGVYRCAYVPRAFKELRRITMAGNMLSDHKAKPYYEALLELRSVREAAEYPPRWTAFDEDDTCSCCASRFTWASTSSSQAQEARDKHNCRSCGTLVCDPCSTNRVALPSIGLCVASRVCDRCYNDMNGMKNKDMTSSFVAPAPTAPPIKAQTLRVTDHDSSKPIRERQRRSKVVDELASRVQSSPVTVK